MKLPQSHRAVTAGTGGSDAPRRTAVKKRSYSREFETAGGKRLTFIADRVPPDLARKVRLKAKREGVSLRTLILRLLTEWLERTAS